MIMSKAGGADLKAILLCTAVLVVLFTRAEDKGTSLSEPVVIENREFRLVIGGDAVAQSLVYKPSGQECLVPGVRTAVFSITQKRPYDNELQLSLPAKETTFPAKSVVRKGNKLVVEFEHVKHIAEIGLKITESYIGFSLDKLDYSLEDYRVKRVTGVDEFTLLELPVKDRKNFGEWLNVMWDDNVAVNLLGTDPHTRIDAYRREGCHLLNASAVREVKITGCGCALIATAPDKLLDRISKVEEDYGLPEGVKSRRSPEYKYSYYELRGRGKLLETIDRNIEYAKQGGFRIMVVYWTDFAKAAGHFEWNKEFSNGMEDLRKITSKIRAAGMIPGFHFHYNKASLTDPYVTPVPDRRLNLRRVFTLSDVIDTTSDVIPVEENPAGCTLEDRRRILRIGNELLAYEGYTADPPWKFTGCKRAVLGTSAASYDAGTMFGLLDVDTWPVFVRFNQNTGIQREVAERIAGICEGAGFEFLYFDGAEDVPPPYWFNAANAQNEVYKALKKKPLLSEGAMKSHFSWHILTRGNAFDHFAPEVIKDATRKYPLTEAEQMSRDFTSLNFGWMSYIAPGNKTIGTQPDMFEFVASHAAGWNCALSLAPSLDNLDRHPRTADNLEVLRRWEDLKINGQIPPGIINDLRDPAKEHTVFSDAAGKLEIHECEQIIDTAGGSKEMRAFIFERKGRQVIMYWHPFGEAKAELNVAPETIRIFRNAGTDLSLKKTAEGVEIPVGERCYIETSLSRQAAIKMIKSARIIPAAK